MGINVITFTVQIYNALPMQGKRATVILGGGMAPLPPPNPFITETPMIEMTPLLSAVDRAFLLTVEH